MRWAFNKSSGSLLPVARSRRGVAAIAAVALIAAACGGDDAPDTAAPDPGGDEEQTEDPDTAGADSQECDPEGVTLRVTFPGRLGPTLPSAAEALQERHGGLQVELSDSATSYTDNLQQIVADDSAGMTPDVIMASTGQVAFYADALGAREIDPAMLLDSYNQDYLVAGEVDGTLHAVPMQVSIPIVVWNKEIFEEAGLDPDTPPETNSEVLDFAEQIAAGAPDVSPAFYPSTIVYDWFFQNMLMSAGGEMVDEQGQPSFATEEGVIALEPWVELNARELHAPASGLEGIEIFASGDIGFVLATNAVLASIDAGVGDSFDWGVAPAPVADEGERRFAAGGNALMVLAEDDCQAQFAEEFIEVAITPETQAAVAEQSGYIPVDTEALNMLEGFYADNPQYAAPAEYEGTLEPWIAFRGDRAFEASEEFRVLLESVAAGADPATALQEAAENVAAILGSGS